MLDIDRIIQLTFAQSIGYAAANQVSCFTLVYLLHIHADQSNFRSFSGLALP